MINQLGLIQVYTGDGKGKTTAALGLAFRASGHGIKTLMLQFLKDDQHYGEFIAKGNIPNFTLEQVGRNDFVNFSNPDIIDIDLAKAGFEKAKKAILSGEYDIVILDEFTLVIKYNLVELDEVLNFLKSPRPQTEIIITGRYAPEELIQIADLVTEMKNEKHYFSQGVNTREGVDH